MDYGQRQWMIGYIADGLRSLGLDVTPTNVERELARVDRVAAGPLRAAAAAHPDPYAPGIATMRAAAATPQATFADRWKAERTAALAAERTRYPASTPARPLSDADRRRFTPPDSYAFAVNKEATHD